MSPSDDTRADRCCTDDEGQEGGQHASTAAPAPQLTGYVGSVRDDLTAFVSAEREAAACAENGAGAVSRTLAILARLGEDLGRMVRLKGRVEHQVRTDADVAAPVGTSAASDIRWGFSCRGRERLALRVLPG